MSNIAEAARKDIAANKVKQNGTDTDKPRKKPKKWPDDALPLSIGEEEQIAMLREYLKDRFVEPEVHGTNKPDLIVYVTPKRKS